MSDKKVNDEVEKFEKGKLKKIIPVEKTYNPTQEDIEKEKEEMKEGKK